MKLYSDAELAHLLDHPLFRLVAQTADELELECYVVGGFVRDLFLERPSKDIDIVVTGRHTTGGNIDTKGNTRNSILLAQALKKKLGRHTTLSVFKNFGTAQLKAGNTEIELVGARKESYSHDSRKPIVEDGTIDDDQRRRDFTINAMAICLNSARFGTLVDPFDGIYDLEDKIIRTPLDPDITFSDDPLRMMRCVRFATQLSFQIDDETFDALSRNRERIKIVSGERIIDELNKIIMADTPSRGIIDLHRCGLLGIIFPELTALEGVEVRNGRGHKDNFYHTLEVLDNVARAGGDLWLRWAALMHDIGKPRSKRWDPAGGWTFHNHNFLGEKMVAPIFRRMKLPMDERMKYVEKLVSLHMRPIAIADDEVTDSAVRRLLFEAGDDIDDLMTLCNADVTSKNEERRRQFHQNFELVKEKLVAIEEKDRIRNMKFAVDGDEIMQMFDLPPSREVGVLKNAMKEAILDGIIPNEHDACVEFLKRMAANNHSAPSLLPQRGEN